MRVSVLQPYLLVLVCLLIEVHWNFKVCCVFLFKVSFQIGGAVYLRVQLIHGLVQYDDQEIL